MPVDGRRRGCNKPHGSWTYVVDVPVGNGRRRQVTKAGYRTRREAEAGLSEALSRIGRGEDASAGRRTVSG
ncbi:MAG: Arm DNA-binding domain-containing protein [Mycobacteriales bacterium]